MSDQKVDVNVNVNVKSGTSGSTFPKIVSFVGFCFVVLVILVSACTLSWCWKNRDTKETRKAARKAAAKLVREATPEGVLPALTKLVTEKSRHIWFEPKDETLQSKWKFWTLRWGDLTAVPIDYVGQLTEDQFIRFAGNGKDVPANTKVLKDLLAFSETLLKNPDLTKNAAQGLSERRLDGYFLANDFDGAIKLLETEGLPNRTKTWQQATASKLRAHKAMEAKDWTGATTNMLAFIAFMLSDEQKDFEDCDPTTGIVYSRDWVVALNYERCSKFMKDANDAAKSKEYHDLAGKYYTMALDKAKGDESSLKALVEEMKAAGFPVDPKILEKKPAEKPVEAKPAEPKPVEAKPAEKPAEAKPAEKPAEAK